MKHQRTLISKPRRRNSFSSEFCLKRPSDFQSPSRTRNDLQLCRTLILQRTHSPFSQRFTRILLQNLGYHYRHRNTSSFIGNFASTRVFCCLLKGPCALGACNTSSSSKLEVGAYHQRVVSPTGNVYRALCGVSPDRHWWTVRLTCIPLKAIVAETGCGFQVVEALSYQLITTSPYLARARDEVRGVTYACTLSVHGRAPPMVTPIRRPNCPLLSRGITMRELWASK